MRLTVTALLLIPSLLHAQGAETLGKAVAEMDRLDAMRSTLAATFAQSGAPADLEAFGRVCKPVGMAMQQAAVTNGWTARQVAVKNRNPANAADPEAVAQMQRFETDSALRAVLLNTTMNGRPGVRYLRRITVESSCLLCHGALASRPAFIAANYPQDRAFGFKVGDLRGAYSVFIPAAP
ncbi:MAG: DUF3365 domain-containing protein [Gemmatimonadaceae bacterium]|nr:DUF3365 domain-containing protein [Gemmatimonadaceae bacterium]